MKIDDIRAAVGKDIGLKHLLRLAQGTDKPAVDAALNALVNLVRYGIIINPLFHS